MVARYRPDHVGFGRFMVGPEIARIALTIGNKVMADARENTPVGTGENGGHMRDRYRVEGVILAIGKRNNRRAASIVSNDSPHAPAVEFGNSHMRARRPLGRAAAKHGEFKGEP